SSLHGENLTERSAKMSWYTGAPLLELLETMEVHKEEKNLPARFPIQYVIRPRSEAYHDYRGYAGRVASGSFRKGDKVTVLPSMQESTIESLTRYKEEQKVVNSRQ